MFFVPVRESLRWQSVMIAMFCLAAPLSGATTAKAQNEVMGELEIEGKTKLEQSAGVRVAGNNGGDGRQWGYVDYVQKVLVQPGAKKLGSVTLQLAAHATVPDVIAKLKLNI